MLNARSSLMEQQHATAATRSTWVSVIVNIILAVVQVVVGLLAHSQALIADGLHSLADLASDIVVLVVSRHSKKDADPEHPYGHQRFETAASLLLGVLLMAVGAGMLWSALHKLETPENIPAAQAIALWVALGSIAAKEALFRYMLQVAKQVKSSMLVANAWHARSDAASSLVVSLGVSGSLLGLPLLDPIASLIVGLMVARMGWTFGWDALNDLMDHSVDAQEVQAIRATLLSSPGVAGVHDLRTRKMGDMVIVDAHLEVDATLTVEQGHHIAVVARQAVLERHQVLDLMTHVDPAHRPDHDHDPNSDLTPT